MLNAKSPVLNIGRAEVAIHCEGVARAGAARRAVATLDKSCNVGRIDRRSLIRPVKAIRSRAGNRNPSGEYVSDARATGRSRASCVKNRCAGGNDAEAKKNRAALEVLLRHVGAHGKQIVDDAATETNNGGAFAGDVPGHAKAR